MEGTCGKNMGNDLLIIPCDLPKDHTGACERNVWPVNAVTESIRPDNYGGATCPCGHEFSFKVCFLSEWDCPSCGRHFTVQITVQGAEPSAERKQA